MARPATVRCTLWISPSVPAATALSTSLFTSGLRAPAQAVNVNRHDFLSASAPLNVRGCPSSLVSTSAVGTVPWRTATAPAAPARFSAAWARSVAISNRLTRSVHMRFHLRHDLHQILGCVFRHRASGWRTQAKMAHTRYRATASFPPTRLSPRQLSKAIRLRSEEQILALPHSTAPLPCDDDSLMQPFFLSHVDAPVVKFTVGYRCTCSSS